MNELFVVAEVAVITYYITINKQQQLIYHNEQDDMGSHTKSYTCMLITINLHLSFPLC